MAYAAGPVPPVEPKQRPGVVTAASYLLYLAAACQVVSAIVTLSQLGAMKEGYRKAFAGSSVKGAEDMLIAITAATTIGVGLLFAIGYVVLGILDGRGKQPARIVTWVVGGLSICCSGASLISNAAGVNSLGGNSGNGAPSGKQIQDALKAVLPGWYQPVLSLVGVLAIVALVGAVVLLALPMANDFFRRPKPQQAAGWEPPVPPPTA